MVTSNSSSDIARISYHSQNTSLSLTTVALMTRDNHANRSNKDLSCKDIDHAN